MIQCGPLFSCQVYHRFFICCLVSLFRLLILQIKKIKILLALWYCLLQEKKNPKNLIKMGELLPSYRKKDHHTYLKAWNLIKNTSSHPHPVIAVEGNNSTIATWPAAIVISGDSIPLLSAGVTITYHLQQIGTIANCIYCKDSKITGYCQVKYLFFFFTRQQKNIFLSIIFCNKES